MNSTTPRTVTGAMILAAALGLTACGNTDTTSTPTEAPASSAPATSTAAPSMSGTPAAGPHNNADVMFAQMMIPHHQQAIEMSDLMLAKTDSNAQVLDLAQRIKDAQTPEIVQMSAWLDGWGVPTAPSMSGNHGGMGGGMMTQADMDDLKNATGDDAAELFLRGMIEHHQGAIDMAESEIDHGQNPEVKQLANNIATSQQAEIDQMKKLLTRL